MSSQFIAGISLAWIIATVLHDLAISLETNRGLAQLAWTGTPPVQAFVTAQTTGRQTSRSRAPWTGHTFRLPFKCPLFCRWASIFLRYEACRRLLSQWFRTFTGQKRACVWTPFKSISTNGSNRPNSQTWHRLANGGIGGESEVQN